MHAVLIVRAAVEIAIVVIGEMVLRPVPVENLNGTVAAIRSSAIAQRRLVPVDLQPDSRDVGRRQPARLKQNAGHQFQMRVLAVQVDRTNVLPWPVAREVDPERHRRIGPLAIAPVPHRRLVAYVRSRSIDADERRVHLGVAHRLSRKETAAVVLVTDLPQLRPLAVLHNQIVDGVGAGRAAEHRIERIIDNVQRIGYLLERVVDESRRRPGSRTSVVVSRLDVELHHGTVGLGWNLGRVRLLTRHRYRTELRIAIHSVA